MTTTVDSTAPAPAAGSPALALEAILAPLYERARHSASLLASRHPVRLDRRKLEIPRFIHLGPRGGGTPLRLAFFAGLDGNDLETTSAMAQTLTHFEQSPNSTRDFALFVYPVVNVSALSTTGTAAAPFAERYAWERPDGDVRFFKEQWANWSFEGVITLQTDPAAKGFSARVRSAVIGRDVAMPALSAVGETLPLAGAPLMQRPSDRLALLADHAHGKLIPPPNAEPYPFELDLFAPGHLTTQQRIAGATIFLREMLARYRRLIAHAANL